MRLKISLSLLTFLFIFSTIQSQSTTTRPDGFFINNNNFFGVGAIRYYADALQLSSAADIRFRSINVNVDAFGDILLMTDSQIRLFVDKLGNVGIHTSSPQSKLHILGSEEVSLFDNGYLLLGETTNRNMAIDNNEIQTRFAGSPVRLILNQSGGRVTINEVSGSDDVTLSDGGALVLGNVFNQNLALDQNEIQARNNGGSSRLLLNQNGGVVEVGDDLLPLDVQSDIGNNNTSDHWDNVVADDFITFSDKRVKQNIRQLENTLAAILQLNPVTYQYKAKHNRDGRIRTGFIAQEVRDVFPSVVIDEDVDVEPASGKVVQTASEFLSMNYLELIPITIKALQEQQEEIQNQAREMENLHAENEALEKRLERLEALLLQDGSTPISTETDVLLQDKNQPSLHQNTPNPFDGHTRITYFLPQNIQSAYLRITNQQGRILKVVQLKNSGEGQINLKIEALSAGSYLYSLVVDGKVVDTKQMVLRD